MQISRPANAGQDDADRTLLDILMKTLAIIAIALFATFGCAVANDQVVAIPIDRLKAEPALLDAQPTISTGQPDAEILTRLKAAGYVAVVDLRTASEDRGMDEPAAVAAAGLDYYSLPIAGARGTTFENAKALDDLLAGIDGPVFLHCRSGNRVGALLALSASKKGASADEALDIGRTAGLTTLEPTVRERLAGE